MEENILKSISINKVESKENSENSLIHRLSYFITTEKGEGELWFEVEREFAHSLAEDRCDSAVVALLPLAIKEGYAAIHSTVPISQDLYFNLTRNVIPQLCLANGSKTPSLEIKAPITDNLFQGKGVACGMSLGIDSFATLAEFGRESELKPYQITHLTYFNVGAHHGYDWRLGKSELTSRELYEGQLLKVRSFARENDYPLIIIDSNLAIFLSKFMGKSQFYMTHTYRNIASAMILQRIIGRYHYSAAYNIDRFAVNLDGDSGSYEKWLLPNLSTGSIEFFSANRAWSRFDKTKMVVELESSHNYLTVCFLGIDNCGECDKCRKTLMTIDVMGEDALSKFRNSFNLPKYKDSFREMLFQSIYAQMKRKGVYGSDMKDIFDHALATNFPYLVEPDLASMRPGQEYAVIRKNIAAFRPFPSTNSARKKTLIQGDLLKCLGRFGDWIKVSDGTDEGYVNLIGVELIDHKPTKN